MKMSHHLTAIVAVIISQLTITACSEHVVKSSATDNQETSPASESDVYSSKNKHKNSIWPKINSSVQTDQALEQDVAQLLKSMTLQQKIAQIVQPEMSYMTVDDMREYGFGTYQNGGNSAPNSNKIAAPAEWLAYAEKMHKASVDSSIDGLSIPTMWGTDAVHGHSNVYGATIFPHNIGLGAANNPNLIKKIAAATAIEVAATGIDWAFAPTVAVPRNDRWGRTYEGYSEDPAIVSSFANNVIEGLQGEVGNDFLNSNHIIATTKHFVGDGGTVNGVDRGDTLLSEQELRDIHAAGYITALAAGAQSVMASFNSWNGKRLHEHKYLLTDVLKNKMGFDGFVVSDWYGHTAIEGCTESNCPEVINAGVDVVMVPEHFKAFYANTIKQVKSGQISQARIDDAVTRILRVKMRMGLFNKASPANRALAGKFDLLGSKSHRDIARQAVRESLVLLKNKNNVLPLKPKLNVLIVGDGANNLAKQNGGWTLSWQGNDNTNKDFPGATSIYAGIKTVVEGAGGLVNMLSADKGNDQENSQQPTPDVIIAVYGEEPYAEWFGDISNLEYQRGNKRDLALLKQMKEKGVPIVSIFLSGRPMWVNKELNASDAFVAAWLPGSEGAGIAEVLFKKSDHTINYDFNGKLSFSWPMKDTQFELNRHDSIYEPLFPYGFGLTYQDKDMLTDTLPEKSSDIDLINAAELPLNLFYRELPKNITLSTGETVKELRDVNIAINSNNSELNSTAPKSKPISITAITKTFQEDARRLIWQNSAQGLVALPFIQAQDWIEYLRNQASIQFDIRIDQPITAELSLMMNCGENCQVSLPLNTLLSSLPDSQTGPQSSSLSGTLFDKSWRSISVDLSCFAQRGMDFSKVIIPWGLSLKKAEFEQLSHEGNTSLSIANIQILPHTASTATMTCL